MIKQILSRRLTMSSGTGKCWRKKESFDLEYNFKKKPWDGLKKPTDYKNKIISWLLPIKYEDISNFWDNFK